jgi:transcriptional regulator GlxA family with amidase domain
MRSTVRIRAGPLVIPAVFALLTSPVPAEGPGRSPGSPPKQSAPPRRDGLRGPVAPPGKPAERRLRAGFLVVDGVYNSELMAPYDVLHHTVFHTRPKTGIEVFTVSPDGKPVRTFEGIRIVPHFGFRNAPEIDILVVPSAEGSMDRDLENRDLIDWVRARGGKARFVVSLCDGAFVLARAGLLDGRAVTTFPADQDRFAEKFPGLDLRCEPSFVHDGAVLTSQGGAESYLVAMYLIDHLYGEEVARKVGKGLLIPWRDALRNRAFEVVPPGGSS